MKWLLKNIKKLNTDIEKEILRSHYAEYLDGDFSDALICEECSHTWEQPDWQNWKESDNE